MGRYSFFVSTLLSFAFAALVLAFALFLGIFGTAPGGVASGSPTPRPSGSFVVAPSTAASPSATVPPVTLAPTSTAPPQTGNTYTVRPGDSLSAIGDKLGVDWQLIAQANGIEPPDYVIQVGQVLIIPEQTQVTPGPDFYVVQAGDSITAIADLYDIDPTTLADFNNIADWNSIRVGDILYIPSSPDATPRPLGSPAD